MEELEQHDSSAPRLKMRHFIGGMALWVGMLLALLAVWLNSLGDDIRIERMRKPWPAVCLALGFILVVGWAAFLLTSGSDRRKIGMYELAEQSCLYRRHKLLHDVEARETNEDEVAD